MSPAWRRGRAPRKSIAGIALVAGLTACAVRSVAPSVPTHTFPVREYAFPSGLRVVVEDDDTSAVAGAVLVVEAGSVDDPPDKNGLAHAFEHLALRAPGPGGSSLWKTGSRLGASAFNAETGVDNTTYYAFVPRASLDDLVAALLGRMADPMHGIDDPLLARETAVVAEELRTRRTRTAGSTALAALLPAGDPYARVFAHADRLDALTLADVRAFAARAYRPERMTLVISGAVGSDWQNKLPTLLPPALAGRGDQRVAAVRRQPRAVQRESGAPAGAGPPIVKTTVEAPELWTAWPVPPATTRDRARLNVIVRVANEMLKMKVHSPWAPSSFLDAQISLLAGSQSSAFIGRARLRTPGDGGPAQKELGDIIESLSGLNLPLVAPAVRRTYVHAVREATLRSALAMESLASRARVRALAVHEKAGTGISEVIASIESVTVDDVSTFAHEHLQPQYERSVVLIPDEAPAADPLPGRDGLGATALSTEGGGDIEPDLDVSDDDGADGPPIAAAAWAPDTKRARVTVLANGLTVIAMRRPGLPFASMLLGFHGDPQPGEVAGVRAALEQTWLWKLEPVPIDRGVVHTTFIQPDSYQENMNMFSVDAGHALDIVAEQPDRLEIQWPSHPFERWLQAEAQTASSPAERARRTFRAALFGDSVYRLTPTLDAVRTVRAADVESWLQVNRRPNNGALVIVGDLDVDEMTRSAARRLAGWTGDAAVRPPPPGPPVVPASRRAGPEVLFTRDGSRRSSEVRFGCVLPPIDDFAADVRSDVLASLVQDDLRRGLRMRLGVNYALGVTASTRRGGTATLEGAFDVEDASLPAALDILRGWLDPARPAPLKAAAFERVRRNHARRSVFHAATNGTVARALFYAWNLGWPLAALDDYPNVLARMTIADVGVDLAGCRTSAVISVLGRGPMPPAGGISPASSH